MRILHVNTDDASGGAAKVARILEDTHRAAGHETALLVGRPRTTGTDVHAFPFGSGNPLKALLLAVGVRYAADLERWLGLQYCLMPAAWMAKLKPIVRWADVIHVHNSHGGYMNLWAVAALSRFRPVVWTLHDEWAYTGHCAYTVGCERWRSGCGACPDLGLYPQISVDTTRLLWRFKSRSYAGGRFTVTAPSRWLCDRARQSMLGSRPIEYVANGIRTEVFRPRDRNAAREALALPRDKFVVMFAANAGGGNPWKGFDYLVEALRILNARGSVQPFLLGIGGHDSGAAGELGFESRWEGRVDTENVMAAYYAAADAFLLPSVADNSPLTVMESMACGTPVVAFDVGGVPELVMHEKTGYVARYRDAEDFARGIEWLASLGVEAYGELADRGTERIRQDHSASTQSDRFLDVYARAIAAFGAGDPATRAEEDA